ncbi:MAG: hypothetical protein U0X20_07930 [Caldilineaceae bacterium]
MHENAADVWQPDWSQAPEWAVAHTVDINGCPAWHERVPKLDANCFWLSDSGRIEINQTTKPFKGLWAARPGMDWRESLRLRPATMSEQTGGDTLLAAIGPDFDWPHGFGRRPGCESTNHTQCSGILWQCDRCKRWFCCQEGADDPLRDVCDDCWAQCDISNVVM